MADFKRGLPRMSCGQRSVRGPHIVAYYSTEKRLPRMTRASFGMSERLIHRVKSSTSITITSNEVMKVYIDATDESMDTLCATKEIRCPAFQESRASKEQVALGFSSISPCATMTNIALFSPYRDQPVVLPDWLNVLEEP
jgi:hypothetical protein